jgi:GNAT superfamily N-acetyltransferase/catechol 2,3-dioxygenase-like lactoylglutathione lyase family enzyme
MNETLIPKLLHAEPVLAVDDIDKTIAYYHETLGFPQKWTWGNPPNHGGVSWNGSTFLQFSLNPEYAKQTHGEFIWINSKNLNELYNLHQKNKVDIVVPVVTRPWGFTEYTIRDINGYFITFSERNNERKKSTTRNTDTISIIPKIPSADKLFELVKSVGWNPSLPSAVESQFRSASYAVVAEDTETEDIIGCAFLLGDNKSFYYVKDVIVHPEWQGKGIGTKMMRDIMAWLETNGAENATVGLFTGEHLAPFYKQFGFEQACGMYTQVRRKVHG